MKQEKKYNIIGKNLNEDDLKDIKEDLETASNKGKIRIPGEFEKTAGEINLINKIQGYFRKELKSLGLENDFFLSPEQIHILNAKAFAKISPCKDWMAFYASIKNCIYVNKNGSEGPLYLWQNIVHEITHLMSFRKIYIDKEKEQGLAYRSGYTIHNPREIKEDGLHEHFRGFNEAIIEKIAFDILTENKKEILKELDISDSTEISLKPSYNDYINIIDTIAEKIAIKNCEDKQAVWQIFKKGIFTGEMMHLREIEKTFGKGALRIIAAIESNIKDGISEDAATGQITRYFQTDDEKEKEKIAEEILVKEGKEKYDNRRN